MQRPEGYRLVGAFEEDVSEAAAVAGFRIGHNLAWGHYLYVDDLSTLPEARRRGHGRALLEWLLEEGRGLGCDQLHLDSGVGLDRADAHRLYLNAGMVIASHHFARYVRSATSNATIAIPNAISSCLRLREVIGLADRGGG